MKNERTAPSRTPAKFLALCLALALPAAAGAQEEPDDDDSATASAAEAFLAANFLGLPLPTYFELASGAIEPASESLDGHQARVVFTSDGAEALAVIEADMFEDSEDAQEAFDARTADAIDDGGLVLVESAWVSVEDPTTTILCWHEPVNAGLPPDQIDCASWTEGQAQVMGVRIEGAALDSLDVVQRLLRQGHDMLPISWFTAEEAAL